MPFLRLLQHVEAYKDTSGLKVFSILPLPTFRTLHILLSSTCMASLWKDLEGKRVAKKEWVERKEEFWGAIFNSQISAIGQRR